MVGYAVAALMAIATIFLAFIALSRLQAANWGGIVWLAALIGMFAIRMPHAMRNRSNVIVHARKDLVEIALLTVTFLTMMVFPLLQLATCFLDFANYHLPQRAMWVGTVAEILFLWMFWRVHGELGRNWSPGLEIRKDHRLVTQGLYKHMRHPMYTALWISVLAQPFLIQNWIAGLAVIPAYAALWFIRIPREEAMMGEIFGAAYEDYCRKTGRLLPRRER